jgi:alpha-glucosidase (family GH31 glycosyl hydrolase)
MLYSGVNGQGPLDPSEPLYHSEPFWLEANALPGYMSKVGTFVDNYSHVALDIGKTSPDELRIATRFGESCIYVMAGTALSEVIGMYKSLVGRPWLKPRYALGYGQGAYGYDTQSKVEAAVAEYIKHDFPIDTMHIDVDLQDRYCTFTINKETFPDAKGMFARLNEKGVKCSTNITPVINATIEYPVHQELVKKKFYVPDRRYLDGISNQPENQRYMCYEGGQRIIVNPNLEQPGFGDDYKFAENFNSGRPYHGGVNYGAVRGTAGFYPDLNRAQVRKWWGDQYQGLFDAGLSFVWQDMTSPSISKEYGDMKS